MDNFNLRSYLSSNPLTEDNSVQEGIDFLSNRLGYNLQLNEAKLKPEETQALIHAAKLGAALPNDLDDELKAILKGIKGKSESEIQDLFDQLTGKVPVNEEEENKSLLNRLRKFQKAGKANLLPLVMALMFAWNSFGSPAVALGMNAIDGNVQGTELVVNDVIPDDFNPQDANDQTAQDVGVTQDGKSLDDINSKDSQTSDFIEFDHGSGKVSQDVNQQLIDVENDIEKLAFGKSGKIVVKISGHSSNDAGTNSNKSNTSDSPLDQERAETVKKALKDKLGDKIGDVEIEVQVVDGSDYTDQTKVKAGSTDGAGALVSLDVDGLSTTNNIPADAEDVIGLYKNAEYVEPSYVRFIEDKVEDIENNVSTKTNNQSSTTPSSSTPPPIPTSTKKVSDNQIKKDVKNIKSIGRNGQWGIVLRTLNYDNFNIFGDGPIKSPSDNELRAMAKNPDIPKMTQAAANGIIQIRKNPNAFLKRVSNVLGADLAVRQKGMSLKPGKKGTSQAPLNPISEINLTEGFIDDFITDEDIKKYKIELLALLGSMYSSADSKGSLSIVDPEKLNLSSSEEKKLVDLGFSQTSSTGDYVFLDDESKEEIPSIEPDVQRAKDLQDKLPQADDKLEFVNTKAELTDLIVQMFNKFAPQFIKVPSNVRKALTTVRNQIKEEEKKENKDVTKILQIFDRSKQFQQRLLKLNTTKEVAEFIIVSILPHINPSLKSNKATLNSAIFAAMNKLAKKPPLSERKLTKSELAKREDIIMKMKDNKRALVQKYGKDAEAVMYGRATNLAKKQAEAMDQDKIKELVKDALQNPKKADLNKDGKLSDYEEKRGAAIEKSMANELDATEKAASDKIGRGEEFTDDDAAAVADKMPKIGKDKEFKLMEDEDLDEDLDLGHEDNEPHMLKADLYRIGKYAMELYQMVDEFEAGSEEVDFPHWWQAKIIKSKDMLVSAKHYLDFEVNEPQIDAMVDVAQDEEVIDENALGFDDDRLTKDQHSELDRAVRGDSAYTFGDKPYADDQLRYKYAEEMGFLKENARDKASMAFDKMKVGATIKTSKGEFKKVDDKHFEMVEKPGRKFTAKQMTFIKEENLKEGTWSLGDSKQIKDAIHSLEMLQSMDAASIADSLEEDNKFYYNVIGDDLFHDAIDRAEREAAMGNEDRAQNGLADAIGRAEDLLQHVQKREGLNEEEAGEADMVASDIQKAMNASKGDEAKTHQLKKARTAMNKGDLNKAKKIADRIAKQLKSK